MLSPEMLVILDTNIVLQDPLFRQPSTAVFFAAVEALGAQVVLPEVVYREALRKCGDILRGVTDRAASNSKEARRFGVELEPPPSEFLQSGLRQYEEHLQARLSELNIDRAPIPRVEHEVVLERVLARRRPFQKSEAGYRDFLVWQTVLDLTQECRGIVAFISANSRDFADASGALHTELQDDLGAGPGKVFLFNSLRAFVQERGSGLLETDQEVIAALNEDRLANFDFRGWVEVNADTLTRNARLEPVRLGLPPEFEAAVVGLLDPIETVVAVDARHVGEAEVVVTAEFHAHAFVDGWFHHPDYVRYQTSYSFDLVDYDDEYGPYLVSFDLPVALEFNFLLNLETGTVSKVGTSDVRTEV